MNKEQDIIKEEALKTYFNLSNGYDFNVTLIHLAILALSIYAPDGPYNITILISLVSILLYPTIHKLKMSNYTNMFFRPTVDINTKPIVVSNAIRNVMLYINVVFFIGYVAWR